MAPREENLVVSESGRRQEHSAARAAAALMFLCSPVSYRAFLTQTPPPFYDEVPMSMQPERIVGPGDQINLMTYNIMGGELGIDGIAHVIKSQNPDILFTNEDREARSSQTGADLEQLIGMKKLFGESLVDDEGAFGNAIFTRLPVVDFRTYSLGNYRHTEHRTMSAATLRLANGRHIVAATLHAENNQKKVRQEQVQQAVAILQDKYVGLPILFGGDFNDGPGSKTIKEVESILQSVRPDASTTDSDTSPNHLRGRIDHLFVPQGWRVLKAKILGQEGTSDHRAFAARIVVPSYIFIGQGILDTNKEPCHV